MKMKKCLESEFEKLSYEEIATILAELGTIYAEPIKNIKKQEIYASLEYDHSIKNIQKVMQKYVHRKKRIC